MPPSEMDRLTISRLLLLEEQTLRIVEEQKDARGG